MKKFLSAAGAIIISVCILSCPGTTDGGNITVAPINSLPGTSLPASKGIISGTITSDSRGGLDEPSVTLYWREGMEECPTGIVPELEATSTGWNFTFSGVPSPANYHIKVEAEKHQTAVTSEFMLPESEGTSGMHIELVKNWKVETFAEASSQAYAASVLAGIAIDKFGNIFVADYGTHNIQQIDSGSSTPNVFAGSGTIGTDLAHFNTPQAIVVDDSRSPSVFYAADSLNHRIIKIEIDPANSTRHMSVLAGSGSSGTANGVGTVAQFNSPSGLARDGNILYVADRENNCIRTVNITTGAVSTLTLSKSLRKPSGLALDGNGYLYAAELEGHCISKIKLATSRVERVFGTESDAGYVDSKYFFRAKFNQPTGLAYHEGSLFVADMGNHCVRRINIDSGVVSTLAGAPPEGDEEEGPRETEDGIGNEATFAFPIGIAVYDDDVYVTDAFSTEASFLIRKLTADYEVEY